MSAAVRPALLVFTRAPEAGRAKTRLIPALGAQGAADAQREMTTLLLSRLAGLRDDIEVEIRLDGDMALARRAYGEGWRYAPQGEGDLGDRLRRAVESWAAPDGSRPVVIVGSDCPALDARHIFEASQRLSTVDLVLGPALDGGYYLIALRRGCDALFRGVSWGASRVLEQTVDRAARAGLTCSLLEPLRDVDRPEDLAAWRAGARDEGQA